MKQLNLEDKNDCLLDVIFIDDSEFDLLLERIQDIIEESSELRIDIGIVFININEPYEEEKVSKFMISAEEAERRIKQFKQSCLNFWFNS
jgi:hypothetical protein